MVAKMHHDFGPAFDNIVANPAKVIRRNACLGLSVGNDQMRAGSSHEPPMIEERGNYQRRGR
jgi:hypothetical protein